MLADRVVDRDVLDHDRVGLAPRGVGTFCRGSADTASRTRSSAQRRLTAVGRVASSTACARVNARSDASRSSAMARP